MHLRRKAIIIGIAVVLFGVLGVSQLQAQGTVTLSSLSQQIDKLIYRVSTLETTRANNARVRKVENRLATVEAQLGLRSPASTATRPRSTSTPVSTTLSVTVKKPLSIRRGPSALFEFIGLAVVDDKLTVTGRNAAGDWWVVEYKGQVGWAYAPNFSSDLVKVVPTPIWPTLTPRPSVKLRSTLTPTRIRPTPTRRPTQTPTRRPTATRRPTRTPTAVNAYITITRNMNVRRGPGTNYAVLGYAAVGEEFDINGKNLDGDWWRIEFEGQNAWIYAPYVTSTNTNRIQVVPTPAAPPTATPRPQPSPTLSFQQTVEEYAYALIIRDQRAAGNSEESWRSNSQSFRDAAMAMTSGLLANTADYCDESIEETALLVDEYGAYLDNVGYTTRNDVRARMILMAFMLGFAEEFTPRLLSCRDIFEVAVNHILAEE